MKPILILPKGALSPEDIEKLNANELCTVETDDPSKIKFLDPIPAAGGRDKIEQAAIELSRKVLSQEFYFHSVNQTATRSDIVKLYVELLVKGTSLDPKPSKAEVEREIFDDAKADEIRRLAREEAKAERAAAKAKLATQPTKK